MAVAVPYTPAGTGAGMVELGSSTGATGRIGARGQWMVEEEDGKVWQPYVRANLWKDIGGREAAMFGGDEVPLAEEATRLEFAGGLTARLGKALSLYTQAGYQYAVGNTDGRRREGVQGDFGLRYMW